MRCLRGGKLASVNAARNKGAAACPVIFGGVLVDGFDAVGKWQNRNGTNDLNVIIAGIAIGMINSGD